jgi:hypothetical protein
MDIYIAGVSGRYAFSSVAFGRRAVNILDSRGITSVAAAQAALSSMAFTASGFLALKKLLSELICGSIAFPSDLDASGINLVGVTQAQIATRDVSSSVT